MSLLRYLDLVIVVVAPFNYVQTVLIGATVKSVSLVYYH